MQVSITPVILCGGTGTRLWPLSRESYPKQFLDLVEDVTLLQRAALRTGDPRRFSQPVVIANAEHRFIVAEQLRAAPGIAPKIVLEPFGRNTAPAAAIAAIRASREDSDALILLMPADHFIGDARKFLAAVEAGTAAAQAGSLVLFGCHAHAPATGYGYVEVGPALDHAPGVHAVERFVEKPSRETAEMFLKTGRFRWNSGIFLMRAEQLLAEIERHAPAVLSAARAALDAAVVDLDFLRLDADAFASSPSISIDHAVMEKTEKAAVVPVDMQWADLGSWSALWEMGEKDASGNVLSGLAIARDTSQSYVRSDGPLVATLGVHNLAVVATPDAVLIADRSVDGEVKALVEQLKSDGHEVAVQMPTVHRPWGYYQSLHTGERFQVKRITVNPGGKLSLQKHFHRAEHWVVVNGTALVTRGDETFLLRENESTFIPLGSMHRLENPGKLPLNLIEVQSGPYLGEDDIVRTDDVYARLEAHGPRTDARRTG